MARWLLDRAAYRQPLSQQEALPLIRQLASGLAAIHALGLIHGDLNPSNVMILTEGYSHRVVITDFGLSFGSSGGATEDAKPDAAAPAPSAGTFNWTAPEQLTGHAPLTRAIDIYALGVIVHEILTGVRYAPGAPFWELFKTNISPRLHEILVRCLDRDPAKRFSDARVLVRWLDTCV